MVEKESEYTDQMWYVVSHRRPFTIARHYFEGSSGQLDDSSDWKSMVERGIHYMALLTAITLKMIHFLDYPSLRLESLTNYH